MAINGAWLRAATDQASGSMNWGHGFNPVHRIMTEGGPLRSAEVATGYGPGAAGQKNGLPLEMIDATDPLGGWTDEDFADALWGYGPETGTSEHPGLGSETPQFRGGSGDFPPYGEYSGGLPGGTRLRATGDPGIRNEAKLGEREETVSEGWINKATGFVWESETSSPEQYERQTSMAQLDLTREGSQRSGSASEFTAPVPSYRPTWNQRIKYYSRGRRDYDMQPRRADEIIRPFLSRQAGTGVQEWMGANEAHQYQREPLQRQPVPDPFAGVPVPVTGDVYQEESSNVSTWVDVWY